MSHLVILFLSKSRIPGYAFFMTRADSALAYFDGGCDCGKAVLRAYESEMALDDRERVCCHLPFSPLPGLPAERCGAVSGALEVLARLKTVNSSKIDSAEFETLFRDRFMASHASMNCKRLLGYDLTYIRDVSTVIDTDAVSKVCRNLVKQVCAILDELIADTRNMSA